MSSTIVKTICSFTLVFISTFSFSQHVSNCVTSPDPVIIKQNDGTELTIIGKGNQFVSYTQTIDGYTLLHNKSGIYEYAIKDAEENLITSGIKANDLDVRLKNENDFLSNIDKKLNYSKNQITELKKEFMIQEKSMTPGQFPRTGTNKVLMILIKYPDLNSTYTKTNFENFMNQVNYNSTGSFKDYYLANSFNQLTLNTDVFGWYTAANNYSYYGKQNGSERARELVREAVDAAEAAGVNFANYDNDNDGYVDGIIIVHSGRGAEEGSQLQYIWSHRWTMGSYSRIYDGKVIDDYMINPETRSSGMVGIGVFCHEFGHGLGLPDLYDTDDTNGDSEGIGNWGVMGGGGWLNGEKTPANFSAWSKIALGWLTPTVISSAGTYTINNASDNNFAYKVTTQKSNEYFLLENRQKIGFDKYLPGTGMALWHINTDKTNLYPGNNSVNADENLKGVDLEEADGKKDLDNEVNRGDAGDLFPGNSNNKNFDDSSNPNAKTYTNESTGIVITNITQTGNVITFDFGGSFQNPYCNPLYTTGVDDDDYIDGIKLGTINTLGNGRSAGVSYVDNSNLSTNILFSTPYNLKIKNGDNWDGVIAAWIDFNQDNDFNDAGEKLGEKNFSKSQLDSITFTIPGSAKYGKSRLRVRLSYDDTNLNPCTTYGYGETEDYSVFIKADCAAPTATATAIGSTDICEGNSVALEANIGNYTYQWVKDGNYVFGANSSSYLANLQGIYSVIVADSCGATTSNTVNVSVTAQPTATITVTGSTNFCIGTPITLSANTGTGLSYQWKKSGANITGATSSTYITTIGGSYQVEVSNTCGTAASASKLLISNPLPTPQLGNDTTVCQGNSLILTPGSNYVTYKWKDNSTGKTLSVNTSGTYWVEVTDSKGCINRDTIIVSFIVCNDINEFNSLLSNLTIVPNPVKNIVNISFENKTNDIVTISLTNLLGQELIKTTKTEKTGKYVHQFDVSDLSDGMYIIKILTGENSQQHKIIKQ